MRTTLLLIVVAVLAGCESTASKPQAWPQRPASTSKPRPPASLPMPAKPQPAAQVWRVVSVHDGDTLRAIDEGKVEHRIRLAGIDTPERGQPFGNVARERMAALTMGQAVEVHVEDRDRYGRTVARLEVDGLDVCLQLVADGLAWHSPAAESRHVARHRERRQAARGRDGRAYGRRKRHGGLL